MKRNELIDKLVNEGLSEKTLSKLTDNQINILAERMLDEQTPSTSQTQTLNISKDNLPAQAAAKQKKQNFVTYESEQKMDEKLVGKQKNIDKNHNGKIDAQDFKILKGQKKETNEEKPSAGLSKEKKSEIVKKAKKGGDIGKKGKGFEKIADKAAEKYGSEEKGKKVAAAAMWKNVKREGVKKESWVKNLAESEYFHNFTSKGEIMELIQTKLNEVKSDLPDFLSSKAIKGKVAATEQKTAPTKPKTRPTTKPGTKPSKPKHNPYNPGPQPNPAPQAEEKKLAA